MAKTIEFLDYFYIKYETNCFWIKFFLGLKHFTGKICLISLNIDVIETFKWPFSLKYLSDKIIFWRLHAIVRMYERTYDRIDATFEICSLSCMFRFTTSNEKGLLMSNDHDVFRVNPIYFYFLSSSLANCDFSSNATISSS